ncbi:FAD binding domain-containing protein [Trametes elegans]|nr:FAD binding domain-containing protein [Trametes elegans]
MTYTDPVLVAGGGPAGLIAALSLAKNGIPVRVIDKEAAFHTASRGSGVTSRSLEIYHFLGLLDDIRQLGRPLPPMKAYQLPGGVEVLKEWSLQLPLNPTPDRPVVTGPGLAIGQYLIEGIFRKHLATHGVQVELSTELVSLEQDPTGVTATVKTHGSDGADRTETIRAPYVIGADGARGVSRKQIGATFDGVNIDLDGAVWADVQVEGLPPTHWHAWSEAGHFTVSMRPTNDIGGFHVGIIGAGFDPVDLLDQEKFVDFIHKRAGRRDLKFKNFTSMSHWKPKMRTTSTMSSGRVFLVGDVAHVHSPTGGQGLNTSIQDSFNVAWKIALDYKGLAHPQLLASYNVERLPIARKLIAMTSKIYKHAISEGPKESEAPERQNVNRFMQWRNDALQQLDINYRWSPIVLDARGQGGLDEAALQELAYTGYPGEAVHAGDRAPGASALVDAVGKETTFHETFRPSLHTVLIFSAEKEEAESQVQAVLEATRSLPAGTVQTVILARQVVPKGRGDALAYHDKEGYAYGAYGVEEGRLTVIAIRPDTYIGAYVYDANDLTTYFSRIFKGV